MKSKKQANKKNAGDAKRRAPAFSALSPKIKKRGMHEEENIKGY